LLAVNRQVSRLFVFKRGIDRVAAANELMQTEGKRRKAGFWVPFTFVSGKQRLLDRNLAQFLVDAGQIGQFPRSAVFACDALRLASHVTPVFQLHTQRAFDPYRQRVVDEAFVIFGERLSACDLQNAGAQTRLEVSVVELVEGRGWIEF